MRVPGARLLRRTIPLPLLFFSDDSEPRMVRERATRDGSGDDSSTFRRTPQDEEEEEALSCDDNSTRKPPFVMVGGGGAAWPGASLLQEEGRVGA